MASINFVSVDSNTSDSDQNIDALIGGVKWDISATGGVITYSFPDSESDIGYLTPGSGVWGGGFNNAQKNAAREALEMVSQYTNIEFVELGDDPGEDNADGTIRFYEVRDTGTAYGYFPSTSEFGGDMGYADGQFTSGLNAGRYEYTTFMHELGHALGLKHGHETDGPGATKFGKDSMEYSLMTYRSFVGQGLNDLPFYTNEETSFAQTYMIYDIAALQRLYGANYETNATDSVYTFNFSTGQMFINGVGQGNPEGDKIFRTVWDGDGEDTYDLSNATNDLLIDLRPGGYSDFDVGGNDNRAKLNFGIGNEGTASNPDYAFDQQYAEWSRGHLFNALMVDSDRRSLIENAIGGDGDDTIIGNVLKNVLEGGNGVDTINGRGGNDDLFGGKGNDRLLGKNGKDELFGGKGSDELFGAADNDELIGGDGADTLDGGNGRDILNGGKKADTLTGGGGKDTFVFSSGMGTDTITDYLGDFLDFTAFDFGSRQEALDTATNVSGSATFDLGDGDTLILDGVRVNEISLGDILI